MGKVETAIPTCFNGVAQSPIDLITDIVQEQDPGQISFLGYNDQLGRTPKLRLRDFTVQLDFEETLAISYPTKRSHIQPTVKKEKQKQKPPKKKKKRKKNKRHRHQKGKKHYRRRVRRDANVPAITGGPLGEDM